MAVSLDSPRSQLWFRAGNLENQWNFLERIIKDHPFNHAVELFIPGLNIVPAPLSSLSSPSYYRSHLPLSHFLKPNLVSYFSINGWGPSGLSTGRRIDTDDVFALMYQGKIILSVDKDVYGELGLQGVKSQFQENYYRVGIDLTESSFKPTKAGYERVKRCLTEKSELHSDFIFTWENEEAQAQARFMDDFKATKRSTLVEQNILTDFPLPHCIGDCPNGTINQHNGEIESCSAADIHSWLGAVSCGLDVYEGGSPDDYITSFAPADPHSVCSHGVQTRWSGMVSSHHICLMLKSIQKYLEEDGTLPWIAVSVWGFEDSPVSWRSNEHGWYISGDNHYNIIVFKTGKFWLIKTLSTYDLTS